MHAHERRALPGGAARLQIGDIFRAHEAEFKAAHALTSAQAKAFSAIRRCRTAELGGHLDVCTSCGFSRPAYNSCRNRHCPTCQSLAQARWIQERKDRVLPVGHFHVVFTLPGTLRWLAKENPTVVYTILMRAAATALQRFGDDPKWLGAQLGITAVLHTWTRDLRFHPHVHCIVSAGGLSRKGARWVASRWGNKFLFPVRALSTVFRGILMSALEKAQAAGRLRDGAGVRIADAVFAETARAAVEHDHVVHAKRPFSGPGHLFEYLGRYTHRVGISNQRLVTMRKDGTVVFRTRGCSTAKLAAVEFIRRFLQHVLPPSFFKIRHFGLYASSNVPERLALARRLLGAATRATEPSKDWQAFFRSLTGTDVTRCPRCLVGVLVAFPLGPLAGFDPAPPPS